MQYGDLTERIIGCAYEVFNTLGAGFLEAVYERSFVIELERQGLAAQAQVQLDVYYRSQNVGKYFADLVVEKTVVVEVKSVAALAKAHEVQLVNYLVATGMPIGLLINFGLEKVEVRRKVRELRSASCPS